MRVLLLVILVVLIANPAARAGDGVVALQTADSSCADDSTNIYVDCGNGTVTDNRTGLVWLADANCFADLDWHEAMAAVAGLADLPLSFASSDCGLEDHSSPGEWRLPSIGEWEAMIDDADGGSGDIICKDGGVGGPSITNDAGDACYGSGTGSSFIDVASASYWSSTTLGGSAVGAYYVDLADADCSKSTTKGSVIKVWPVRGGQ